MAKNNPGWRGEPRRHAKAAKGQKTAGKSSQKDSGWFGDSEGHSEAAKGEEVKSKGFMDNL